MVNEYGEEIPDEVLDKCYINFCWGVEKVFYEHKGVTETMDLEEFKKGGWRKFKKTTFQEFMK